MTGPLGSSATSGATFDRDAATSNPIRLLVVEDEALVALYLSDILEDLSYDVCGLASSGAEALDIAAREQPVLALVDIGLHGPLDGIQTAQALRDRHAVASLFMSGASDPETLERARTVTPHGFLQKPYSADQLKNALEGILATS